jgi:hypothetical protein
MNYETLYKTPTIEVRKYPPCKRTLHIEGKDYFLQFPYMVFAQRKTGEYNYLYVAFAKEDDQFVYFPSLGHIQGDSWCICLAITDEFESEGKDFDELIDEFWFSRFCCPRMGHFSEAYKSLKKNFVRYREWQKLSEKQVLKQLRYRKTSLKDFIKVVRKRYTNQTLLDMFIEESNRGQFEIMEKNKEPF